MSTPPHLSEETLLALDDTLGHYAPDLQPHVHALLQRDPIIEAGETTPAFFAVDIRRDFAQFILDALSVVGEGPSDRIVFCGRKVSDLAKEWRDVVQALPF